MFRQSRLSSLIMKKSDESENLDGATSEIVRIAYRQSQAISNPSDSGDSPKTLAKEGFACANRIKSLPIIAGINSSITEAYTNVKASNTTVESILTHTEEGLSESAKIVSPVTSKIGETLEQPLRTIDNAICGGLDYLEEKLPSIKLPPGEIYDKVEGYLRGASKCVKKHSNDLYADIRVQLEGLTKAQTEKTDIQNEDRKSDG